MSDGITTRVAFSFLSLLIAIPAKAIGYHELWTRTNIGPPGIVLLVGDPTGLEIDPKGDLFHLSSGSETNELNNILTKYAGKTGVIIWQHHLPPVGQWPYHQMRLDPEGDTYVSSAQSDGNSRLTKFFGETGRLLWEAKKTNAPRYFIVSRNEVVTMDLRTAQTNVSWQITKLSGDDGALVWEKEISQISPNGAKLAVGRNGDVVVGGIKDEHYHLLKLAAFNGSEIWAHQSLQTATNSNDRICNIAIDSSGDVTFLTTVGNSKLHLESVSADTGNLKWTASHPDEKDWASVPSTVVCLEGGDVITEATVYWRVAPGWGHTASYLARYRAADGALVWKRRFEPASTNEYGSFSRPPHLVKDSDDNIVLATTPASTSISGTYKINSATGDIIWETLHPKTLIDGFAYSNGRLAFTGNLNEYTIEMFQIVPELQAQIVEGQFELFWHPEHIGFRLEKSTGLAHWLAVPASTTTNRISLSQSESTGLFRLVLD